MPKELNEPVLSDDYPIYGDYLYVADDVVIRSHIQGTASDLRRELRVKEIRRCDVVGRGLTDKMV